MNLKSLFKRVVHGQKGWITLEFHVLDAFTSEEENTLGNPASVCIVDKFPADKAMGEMAKTLGTAMTTFLRKTEREDVYEVRHFSPDGNENHICGHALIAAGEHLARLYPEFRKGKDITYLVNPRYKINPANAMKSRVDSGKISLTLPAILDLQEVRADKFYQALAEALNIPEDRIVMPVYFAPRANSYLAVLKEAEDLVSLRPDFAKLNAISHAKEWLPQDDSGIIVPFWSLTAKSGSGRYDVLNRVFSPDIGVDEDPACGSANCSAIPYWGLLDDAFSAAGKREFKVLYPYPPAGEGMVGGVQHIKLDEKNEEIVLTAQATFKKIVRLKIPVERKPDSVSKKNPGPGK